MSHPKFQFHFLYLVLIPLISVAVYWQLKSIVLRPGCSAVGENHRCEHSLNKFSVQRAYENLVVLSHEEKGFGEHSFGSRQCHLVHQWLVRWIRDSIAARSLQLEQQQGYFKVEVAEQNESNEFVFYSSHLMGNRMRRYQNVTNIMVKIYPAVSQQRSYSGEAILVNSHFDSGVSSPGAFDDGVPVVAMMEMFQNMLDQLLAHHANSSVPLLRHPIVFLWNGAEEMGLFGAHAFMQSHPWAKDIRAFINLEAAGFGGGATVFQTTNAWIAQEYAKVIVHPLGNSLGQDLFQSGIIPSDTDYRFFTGMKKQEVIHGVDSAFSENGHWYHTEFDSLTKNHYSQDDIKKSIQHMGENAASLMEHLAFMDASFPNATVDAHSRSAYFDVLGLVFFAYNAITAKPIYYGVVSVALTLILVQVLAGRVAISSLVLSLVCTMCSVIGGVGYSLATAHFLIKLERPLSWYALGSEYALILYVLPAFFGSLLTAKLASLILPSKKVNRHSMYASVLVLWMALLIVTAHYGLGSSYLPAVIVISFVAGLPFSSIGLLQLLVSLLLPLTILISLGFTFATTFSGMLGRSGRKPVDYTMSGLVGVVGALISTITLPFLSGEHKKDNNPIGDNTRQGLSWRFLFLLAAASISLIAIGYNASPYSPLRPKRLALRHVLVYEKGIIKDAYLNLKSADPFQPSYVFNKMNVSDHGFTFNATIKSHRISNTINSDLDDPVFYKNVANEISFDTDLFDTKIDVTSEKNADANTKYTITLSNSKYLFYQQVFLKTDEGHITRFYFSQASPLYDRTEGAYMWDLASGYSRFENDELNANGTKTHSFSFDVSSSENSMNGIQLQVLSHFVDPLIWTESINKTLSILPDWTSTMSIVSSQHSTSLLNE